MKTKKIILFLGIFIFGALLSGCASGMTPSSWPGTSADSETAYLAYANQVYAVQLTNGVELWRFPEKTDAKKLFYAPPVLTPDGQLIVSGYDMVLYSLNPQTGTENWTFTDAKDRFIGSVAASSDKIFAPSADFNLYALDLNGNLQWSFETGAGIWSQPVLGEDLVYVASLDSTIYALKVDNGDLVWSTELDGGVLGSLTISDDGMVYAATLGDSVYALNPDDGNILWTTELSGFIWSAPVPGNGSVFVGDSEGKFVSLDAETGTTKWSIQPDGAVLGAPLVMPDLVVFGTESGSLNAIDYDGNTIWNRAFTGQLFGSPVLAGDYILISPLDGDNLLIALDQDGTQRWVYSPSN